MIYEVTYEGKGKDRHKVARPVKNREELMARRNSPENLRHLAAAQQGDDAEKGQLLQLAYNLGHVEGALAGCKSIGSHFFHDVDCYDREASEKTKELILSKKEEIGLEMLERSVSGGWHLVCRRMPGTTILENQVRVATILRLEMDTSAKDLQRVVYSTSGSAEDLVFLDDSLFEEPMSPEECEAEYLQLKERERQGKEDVPAGAKKANKHYRPWLEKAPYQPKDPPDPPLTLPKGRGQNVSSREVSAPSQQGGRGEGLSPFSQQVGLGVSPRIRFIAEGVMKEKELLPGDFLNEGGRHTTVKVFLSGATQLLTKEEVNGVLQELMPKHWADDNIQTLVNDFYQNYTKANQRLLKYQEQLFAKSLRVAAPTNLPQLGEASGASGLPPSWGDERGAPKLIKLLTSKTPEEYKAAVAHAVFPSLATHLCGVRFRYTDNVEHEATLMNCLMAGTGSGKGCIDEPINHIMADIRRRDKENLRREAEWKKDCQKKGANKDKLVRPEGLVIQEIDPDMTKPALVTRMDEAEGHFVYVKLNELDLFEQLKGQTGKQHFQLMCLAFDPGAEYGQTRVGTQSVTARPQCRFNWNACTTILKGKRFFQRVLTDGPISRINFCTIPEQEIGADQPVYGLYDMEFDEKLKPYIDNLTAARGLIDCPQATRLARKLQEECAEFARLSQSEVYWNLSHRACVIAWLKACVLYVANGQKWERAIEDFVRWSLKYDLWCKMEFFGAAIEAASTDTERTNKRGPQNLLELLPDEFTIDDAKRVRQQQGMSNEGNKCQNMIRQWVFRKYVLQITDYSFVKSKKD